MSILAIEELKELVEQPQGLCASIYIPTVRAGAETRQNAIRFRNLLKQAEIALQENGFSHTEALDFLQPARSLDQENFWQHQNTGFALFVSEGMVQYYCLPIAFNELVVVSDQFHLKPLLPLLTSDGEFYILALTQQQVRLFKATRYGIQTIELEGVPQSLDEALQYDETAKDGQNRISESRGGGLSGQNQMGSRHGMGSPDRDQHNQDILQFCYAVDKGLQKYLHDQRSPLVLAGTEAVLPLYRQASSYQHILDTDVRENPEILKPEELHERALPIVEPFFAQTQEKAIDHYRDLSNTGKTSNDPQEAIPAAFYGRVEQLFVPVGVHQWGSFDRTSNELQIHDDAEPGDEDLLNSAAIQTLLNGGTVYAVEPEKVPDSAPIAAVFRY